MFEVRIAGTEYPMAGDATGLPHKKVIGNSNLNARVAVQNPLPNFIIKKMNN